MTETREKLINSSDETQPLLRSDSEAIWHQEALFHMEAHDQVLVTTNSNCHPIGLGCVARMHVYVFNHVHTFATVHIAMVLF